MESLEIPYNILSSEKSLDSEMKNVFKSINKNPVPHIILVSKGVFSKNGSRNILKKRSEISREMAISKILELIGKEDIVISTTGKSSRELYEVRSKLGHNVDNDLRIIGSMGHVSSVALGINQNVSDRLIFCLDGDGSVIMHMGSMSTIGKYSNNNFKHILLNNFSHESVGGQETSSDCIDFGELSNSLSYKSYFKISSYSEFNSIFENFKVSPGPSFLEIILSSFSRADLSRPLTTPQENKKQFMSFLENGK